MADKHRVHRVTIKRLYDEGKIPKPHRESHMTSHLIWNEEEANKVDQYFRQEYFNRNSSRIRVGDTRLRGTGAWNSTTMQLAVGLYEADTYEVTYEKDRIIVVPKHRSDQL